MEEDGPAGGMKGGNRDGRAHDARSPRRHDRQVRPRERDPRHRRRARRAARADHPRLRHHRRRHRSSSTSGTRQSLDDFARNRLGAALAQAEMPTPAAHVARAQPALRRRQGVERARADRHAGLHGRGLRRDRREDARARRQRREPSGRDARRRARADGNIRVVDLWDSEAAFGEFAQTQIGPAAGDAMPPIDAAHRPGLQPPPRPGRATA